MRTQKAAHCVHPIGKGIATVSVYKNEERGTWYCIFRFKNFYGKNIQKKKEGFKKKKDAADYEKKYMMKMAGSCDMTFAMLSEIYLTDMKKRQKETTWKGNQHIIKHQLLPYFGIMKINEITPIIVRNWESTKIIEQYTPKTAAQYVTMLGSMMNYAVRYLGLPINPVRAAGPCKGKKKSRKIGYWTQETFENFCAQIPDEDVAYRIIYELLFWSGCRRGEALGLRIEDIEDKKIAIRQNRVHIAGKKIAIQTPKTATSRRVITVPKKIMEKVEKWIEKLYSPAKESLIFENVTPNHVSRKFRLEQKRQGVEPRIRLHDLRHSHASLLIDLGFSVQAIADRLGHINADQVIRTYGHLYDRKRDEILEALEKL